MRLVLRHHLPRSPAVPPEKLLNSHRYGPRRPPYLGRFRKTAGKTETHTQSGPKGKKRATCKGGWRGGGTKAN